MKLVTFHSLARENRIGAITPEGRIVDLNAAYALYLRNVEQEGAFYALADARVPADMRGLFANGDRGLDAARLAFDYALKQGPEALGAAGESIFFRSRRGANQGPISPKKFFHTAGNFREHHEEAQQSGFSHPVLPWIVFFQNVDAIIGPDEEIVYPEHLTEELDYELELAVVLKKSGKHFSAERARRVYRRLCDFQRRDSAGYPAHGNEVRSFQFLQRDRHILSTRAAHCDGG